MMNARDWLFACIGAVIALAVVQTVAAAIKPKLGEEITSIYAVVFLIGLVALYFFVPSATYWGIAGAIVALLLLLSAFNILAAAFPKFFLVSKPSPLWRAKVWLVIIAADFAFLAVYFWAFVGCAPRASCL